MGAERAYTLIELLVVVSVLSVIAAIAAPALTSDKDAALEQAAIEVASAIRYARSEAVRTGELHGVYASEIAQRIRVYRFPVSTPIYDIYDPLTKQPYEFEFAVNGSRIEISGLSFIFQGLSDSKNDVGFAGGSGTPRFNDAGNIRMLTSGKIKLSADNAHRIIDISPMTGRVTVR